MKKKLLCALLSSFGQIDFKARSFHKTVSVKFNIRIALHLTEKRQLKRKIELEEKIKKEKNYKINKIKRTVKVIALNKQKDKSYYFVIAISATLWCTS